MSDLVVVTGAAGPLGRAVVAEFRTRGLAVAALARPGTSAPEWTGDDGVHEVPADLVDPRSAAAAWAEVDRLGSAPTALVETAGGFIGGALADLTPDVVETMFRTNVDTTLWSAKEAADRMRRNGGGAIVTVGSRVGVTGAGSAAYAAAKAAVVRMTEVLADELRPDKIRVNAVLPSVMDTPANRTWLSADAATRAVPPAAVAKVIAFLCGPDAWPISGAAIPVYGDA